MQEKAHTLIELLISMAIISLVISVMLPPLAAAQAHHRWMLCKANMAWEYKAIVYGMQPEILECPTSGRLHAQFIWPQRIDWDVQRAGVTCDAGNHPRYVWPHMTVGALVSQPVHNGRFNLLRADASVTTYHGTLYSREVGWDVWPDLNGLPE